MTKSEERNDPTIIFEEKQMMWNTIQVMLQQKENYQKKVMRHDPNHTRG